MACPVVQSRLPSKSTTQRVRGCLKRAVRRAMARDLVKRNVVELTEVPGGQRGRPSKSLTPQQADDVLTKTRPDRVAQLRRAVSTHRCSYGGTSGA